MLTGGVLSTEIYLCKKSGVKEGRALIFKGGVISREYGINPMVKFIRGHVVYSFSVVRRSSLSDRVRYEISHCK